MERAIRLIRKALPLRDSPPILKIFGNCLPKLSNHRFAQETGSPEGCRMETTNCFYLFRVHCADATSIGSERRIWVKRPVVEVNLQLNESLKRSALRHLNLRSEKPVEKAF
ncbi:hypothetical protein [Sphaerotilus microaerophilus]|nr:hypothetical protein [Sphaerotilus sp. FB-5]